MFSSIRFRNVFLWYVRQAGSSNQDCRQRIGDGKHTGDKADGNRDGEKTKIDGHGGTDEQ